MDMVGCSLTVSKSRDVIADCFLFLSFCSKIIEGNCRGQVTSPIFLRRSMEMNPTVNEPEIYAGHSHPGYVLPATLPSYGTPQPYAAPYISTSMRYTVRTQKWSTGLCRCLDDPASCLVTCFCPCITFGQIAEIVNKGTSTCTCHGVIYGALLAFTGLACLYSCFYRSKLRAQFDLPEAPCMDCLVHFCCETCALCQEYRELKNYGFDLSIGWEANMERQRRGVTVSPVISQTMER